MRTHSSCGGWDGDDPGFLLSGSAQTEQEDSVLEGWDPESKQLLVLPSWGSSLGSRKHGIAHLIRKARLMGQNS